MSICFFIWSYYLSTYKFTLFSLQLLAWLQNIFYLGMGEELVISPLQHEWNCVVLFFSLHLFLLGNGWTIFFFSSTHTHPFSTFPFEKVNICFFLIQLPFPLEWVHHLYLTPKSASLLKLNDNFFILGLL